MSRKLCISMFAAVLLVCAISTDALARPRRGADRFVDTKDYKSGEYDKGIIEDYSQMVEGDGVEWVYIAPGIKLSEHKIKVSNVANKSKVASKRMLETLEEALNASLEATKSSKGTLTVETAVYWAERASEGKRFIPYAGHHLAQAGAGVEMIFRDSKGNIVALIRHSTREGNAVESAAEELAQDLSDFIHGN